MSRIIEGFQIRREEYLRGGDAWHLGEKTFTSRFIAPVAFQNLNVCIRALDTNKARDVIVASETQFLIVSPPSAVMLM